MNTKAKFLELLKNEIVNHCTSVYKEQNGNMEELNNFITNINKATSFMELKKHFEYYEIGTLLWYMDKISDTK